MSMTADDFKSWLKRNGLTWRAAAKTLDCDISQVARYAGGQTPVPRYRERLCVEVDRLGAKPLPANGD